MTGSRPGIIKYRSDIDGLRAVAVLAVIAFHISENGLRGGYLGVDIFFVISGYLITLIIWKEAKAGRFSIGRFYERRIRRIMPALLLVLFISSIMAVLLLLPADLVGYGESLLATLAFVANIYFWRDTNYFARAAEEKPLLHMWSLGVEEQFYIFFPLLIVLCVRFLPRATLLIVASLSLMSLGLAYVAHRIGAGSPAFFLLPTRAWELGIGAFLALLPSRYNAGPHIRDLAGIIGVAAITLSLYEPRWWGGEPVALPAVIGTALLIQSGKNGSTFVSRVLALPLMVFVGLISYSLYLWHWPIIVYLKYYLVRPLDHWEIILALATMFAGATISWRYVERPFRDRTLTTVRTMQLAGTGAVALAAGMVAIVAGNGFPQRMPADAASINQAVGTNYRCPVTDYVALEGTRACVLNLSSRDPRQATAALVGNSHAQMYAPVWKEVFDAAEKDGVLIPVNGCLPTMTVNISVECLQQAEAQFRAISSLPQLKLLVLGLTWDHFERGLVDRFGASVEDPLGSLVNGLDNLADRFRAAGLSVVLIGPIVTPGWDVPSMVSRSLVFDRPLDKPTSIRASEFYRAYGRAIAHFERSDTIALARVDEIFCHDETCRYILDGRSLFADSNHVAVAELWRFRQIFSDALGEVPQPIAVHQDIERSPGTSD